MLTLTINSLHFLVITSLIISSGNLLLKLLRLNFKSFLENFIFSLTFSLVLLSLVSYAFLIFRLHFLIAPLFWGFIIFGLLNAFFLIRKRNKLRKFKFDWGLALITFVLAVLMTSVTVRSGWMTKDGLEFFGVNANDGLWHLSLIGDLKSHFPPQHPSFAGIELKGYHYLLDLLLAKLSFVFGFRETDLYFRFFPFLSAFLWCSSTFLLAKKYFQNKIASYLTVFFSVLGGGFAYLLPIFHAGGVNLDSDFGVSSPISSLINLQFAFSISILALTLYAFSIFFEEKNFGWGLIAVLFTGALSGIKIYAGMIVLFALGLSSLLYLAKTRRWKDCWVTILSGFLAALVYLSARTEGASLVYAPGEMIQNIIRGPLNWTLWEIRRQVYAQHQNILGLARMRTLAFLVFLFGNLGTKILGLGEILRFGGSQILTKNFGFFAFAVFFSFLIPVFFIQSITPFNIIQFWWYFLYFMSFLAASFLWRLLQNKKRIIQASELLIVFALTIPAALFVLSGYLFNKASYKISHQQLAALNFLKDKTSPNDVILDIPSTVQTGGFNFGLPIVPAVAQRRIFVGAEIIEFPYLDKERREKELKKIITPLNCFTRQKKIKDGCQDEIMLSYAALSENKINYIFSHSPLFWLEENSKMTTLVYKRDGVFIYKIIK